MRSLCLISTLLFLCVSAISQTRIYSSCTQLLPPDATERVNFGCSLAIQGNELFVGGWNNGNGNKVYVYEIDEYADVSLKQIIQTPEKSKNCFGYLLAVSGDKMVITASTSQNLYCYRKIDGVWTTNAVARNLPNVPNCISMYGNTIVVTSLGNAVICTIDNEGNFIDDVVELENTSKSAGCMVSENLITVAKKNVSVHFFEKENEQWVRTDTIADESVGYSNITYFVHENDEVVWGNQGAQKVNFATKHKGTWSIDTILCAPDTYIGDSWGRTVVKKDNVLIVSGNFIMNQDAMPAYYYEKINGSWTLTTELFSNKIMGNAAAYNGRIYVNSNQNNIDGKTLLGCVYLFDLSVLGNQSAITNVIADSKIDNSIYNLQGQKVDNPSRGLYIRNRKLIMKR